MCLAIPGKLISIEGDNHLERSGKVNFSGVVKSANLAFLPEAKIGDYILVHVGVGLSIINQNEAEKIFSTLDQLEEEIEEE